MNKNRLRQILASEGLRTAGDKQTLVWSARKVREVLEDLEGVVLELERREGGSLYEGNESLADVYSEASDAVDNIQKASTFLHRASVSLQRVRAASYDGNPDGKPIYPKDIDHGYGKPISGGSAVMKDLVKDLRNEQGS